MDTIRTVQLNGDYALVRDNENTCPWAVMHWTGSFWQQITPWYFHKGTALNRYNQLIGDK